MTLVGLAGVAAGIPVGVALTQWLREPLIEDSPWLQDFADEFHLTALQLHQVRRVLAMREREIVEAYAHRGYDMPAELSRTIRTIRRRADERIEAVLDSAQHDRYMKLRPMAEPTGK
jgi:hypothetical protein